MALRLFNTLTGGKEDFQAADPRRIGMYVCGPTVYAYAHIGNARPAVVFDVLFRLLRHLYGADHVVYVRNITDVDDKIIQAAARSGEPIAAITRRTTDAYHADMHALGCLDPTVFAAGKIDDIPSALDALITPRLQEANFVLGPMADGIPVEPARFHAVADWVRRNGAA